MKRCSRSLHRTIGRTTGALNMQFVCIFFHICWISAEKFEFLFSQGSVATCLRWGRWVMSYRFRSKCQCKNWLRFNKDTEFKGENFLTHSVYSIFHTVPYQYNACALMKGYAKFCLAWCIRVNRQKIKLNFELWSGVPHQIWPWLVHQGVRWETGNLTFFKFNIL